MRVTMRPLPRHARWTGVRANVLSALLLVFPTRTFADRTLCFTLPPPELLVSKSDPDTHADTASVYLGMNAERCVPRAERDLRAAAVRARLPDDDQALRCVDAHEAFVCSSEFAANDDPFACETLDGADTYRLDVKVMETCVWPVCESLCVQATAPAPSRGAHRRGTPVKTSSNSPEPRSQRDAHRHHSTCARCGRACDIAPPKVDTPGGHYCAALAAQRLGVAAVTERESANKKETDKKVDPRARYGGAWGCPGCDGGATAAFAASTGFQSQAQLSAAAAALASVPVTASSVGSVAAASAAASTVAVGGAAALVGNFLFISARIALLNIVFWAVIDSLYVVVRPGDEYPGYVYAQGSGNGGDGKVNAPPPPPPFIFGNAIPPPISVSVPNLSPPPFFVPTQSPPAPPAFPLPPSSICGAGDIVRSCVGECGMCIFEPEAEAPNCCCDEECAELGDCCGDFGTCCTGGGAKLGVRVDARHGTRRRVARRDSVPYRDIGRDFGGVDQTDLENLEEQMDLNGFGQPSRGFIRPVRAASGARAMETVPIVVGSRTQPPYRGSQGSTMTR